MNDAAFWASLCRALIAVGAALTWAGAFLFYRLRLHRYIAVRRRQRQMGMPLAKGVKKKKRKKGSGSREEGGREEAAPQGDGAPPEPEPDKEREEADAGAGTGQPAEGGPASGPAEPGSRTEDLDEDPGTALLKKEQKEEADRTEDGGAWIPASKTFRITKKVVVTHAGKGKKNNGR